MAYNHDAPDYILFFSWNMLKFYIVRHQWDTLFIYTCTCNMFSCFEIFWIKFYIFL